MKKIVRAIVLAIIWAFLGLLFTPAESGGVWFLLGIFALFAEWRYSKDESAEVDVSIHAKK